MTTTVKAVTPAAAARLLWQRHENAFVWLVLLPAASIAGWYCLWLLAVSLFKIIAKIWGAL